MERLDKLLSRDGTLSRRDAQKLIRSGAVQVDGTVIKRPEHKLDPDQSKITVNGIEHNLSEHVYLMMNKPAGVVSATEDKLSRTVIDLVPEHLRRRGLAPAGRLDKDSVGLLLLTDDGDFAHRVISPRSKVIKRYFVRLDGDIDDSDIKSFEEGLALSDGFLCMPAKLYKTGDKCAEVEICEGKFHQVKRMFRARGLTVTYLKRLSIGGLRLDETLAEGESRELSKNEKDVIFIGI